MIDNSYFKQSSEPHMYPSLAWIEPRSSVLLGEMCCLLGQGDSVLICRAITMC